MDRSSLFLFGNSEAQMGSMGSSGGGGGQFSDSAVSQVPGGGPGVSEPQLQFAGYPSFMAQYYQQPQQHPQQQPPTSGMDPRFAGFSGFPGGGGPAMMTGGSNSGMGNVSSFGINSGGYAQAPGMMANHPGSGMMMPMNMNPAILSQPWIPPTGYAMPGQASFDDPYAENGVLAPWSSASAALLGKMGASSGSDAKAGSKKGRNKRVAKEGKPKRPLSAYNLFFKAERARILAKIPSSDKDDAAEDEEGEGEKGPEEAGKNSREDDKDSKKRKKRPHGKIGFESLAKVIGKRWQDLDPEQVEHYKKEAEIDMKRYKQEMEVYLGRKDLPDESAKEADGEDGYKTPLSKKVKPDEGIE